VGIEINVELQTRTRNFAKVAKFVFGIYPVLISTKTPTYPNEMFRCCPQSVQISVTHCLTRGP